MSENDTDQPQGAYVMYSVFRVIQPLPEHDDVRTTLVREALAAVESVPGLTVRGWYDVAGFRADADLMVWWFAEDVEPVQEAYHRLLASELGAALEPVWSQVGTHRPAEFNRAHLPAFLMGEEPRGFLCVYPFVRSYEWYLLPAEERSTMLRDHGLAARDYADVRANTISSFALGDYEWLLGFEADDLGRIVDLMRDLRATEARRHVREEVPFFTGPRRELGEIVERLPRG
ncbi:hydrogen peroxide-dependent heme synthase [Georgenia sp. H159]|uniref:hydrogen peroxide-dependent heme synthase n=1 Tax=Georgenia sp. H159 TaxID=3076115 RepID=UPI002D767DAD|nr:hydrogen peroxide-dependent heme synthase [Georgenia sp. H159]